MIDQGTRLRQTREAAQLTQGELAALSGVSQSNISAYERGSRPMSAAMLERLLDATAGTPGQRLRVHRDQVVSAIAAAGVSDPAVFGSVARGQDHRHSDLDLLVTAGPHTSYFDLIILRTQLEDLLGCRVDIVTRGALRSTDDPLVTGAIPL